MEGYGGRERPHRRLPEQEKQPEQHKIWKGVENGGAGALEDGMRGVETRRGRPPKRQVADGENSATLDRVGRERDEPQDDGNGVEAVAPPALLDEARIGGHAEQRSRESSLEIPDDLLGVTIGHPDHAHHRNAERKSARPAARNCYDHAIGGKRQQRGNGVAQRQQAGVKTQDDWARSDVPPGRQWIAVIDRPK